MLPRLVQLTYRTPAMTNNNSFTQRETTAEDNKVHYEHKQQTSANTKQ